MIVRGYSEISLAGSRAMMKTGPVMLRHVAVPYHSYHEVV